MARLFDTKEAAAYLGVSDSRIRQLLLDGRLKGVKVGNSWGFTEATLKRYAAKPPNGRKHVRR